MAGKYKIGVCNVKFGEKELGTTKDGVTVTIASETAAVEIDQSISPIDEILTKLTVEVEIPLAELDLTVLESVIPNSKLTGSSPKKLVVDGNTSGSLLELADELVLTPISGDSDDTFTVLKAAFTPDISFSYTKGEQRVFKLKAKGYTDANGDLFLWGDKAATA